MVVEELGHHFRHHSGIAQAAQHQHGLALHRRQALLLLDLFQLGVALLESAVGVAAFLSIQEAAMAGERVALDAPAEIDQFIGPEVLPAQRLGLDVGQLDPRRLRGRKWNDRRQQQTGGQPEDKTREVHVWLPRERVREAILFCDPARVDQHALATSNRHRTPSPGYRPYRNWARPNGSTQSTRGGSDSAADAKRTGPQAANRRCLRCQATGIVPHFLACGGVPHVCPTSAGKQPRNASGVRRPPSDRGVVVEFGLADFRVPEVGMAR